MMNYEKPLLFQKLYKYSSYTFLVLNVLSPTSYLIILSLPLAYFVCFLWNIRRFYLTLASGISYIFIRHTFRFPVNLEQIYIAHHHHQWRYSPLWARADLFKKISPRHLSLSLALVFKFRMPIRLRIQKRVTVK